MFGASHRGSASASPGRRSSRNPQARGLALVGVFPDGQNATPRLCTRPTDFWRQKLLHLSLVVSAFDPSSTLDLSVHAVFRVYLKGHGLSGGEEETYTLRVGVHMLEQDGPNKTNLFVAWLCKFRRCSWCSGI